MSLIGELARFAADVSFEDLPGEVVEAAKMRILDNIGGGIWGRRAGEAHRLLKMVDGFGGNPEAVLWGENRRAPAIWAAFVNGYSSFYVSDTDRFCGSHAGAVVISAAMAAAELKKTGGKEFITAVAAGYEVFSRVGLGLFPEVSRKGFHTTGVIGPLGAAAAAARMFGFDRTQTANALSIAAQSGMGLGEAFKNLDTVSLNIGRVSQSGLIAALLTETGFQGTDTILEGGSFIKDGFLSALVGSYDGKAIAGGLGTQYKLLNSAPKIHGGCRHLAAPTDAVMELAARHDLKPDAIEEIRVHEYSEAFRLERGEVRQKEDALWSSRFTIAAALATNSPVYPTKFTNEMLNDRKIQELMARIKVSVDPELDQEFPRKWPARVEILTKDGGRYKGGVDFPRGEPENPISKLELVEKFKSLVSPEIGPEKAEEIIKAIERLDEISIGDLAELL